MKHRKPEHKEKVKKCIKSISGECYYNINCQCKHDENETVNQNQNKELFNKIFDIMEKFTHRIVNIENNLQNEIIGKIRRKTVLLKTTSS